MQKNLTDLELYLISKFTINKTQTLFLGHNISFILNYQ